MTAAIGLLDVLCGRGGATNNHPGNKRFRAKVAEHMPEYLQARKKEKAVIAKRIVHEIKQDGGRFLKHDANNDVWVEVTDKRAREKTSQALREGLDVRHKTYRPEKMPRRDSDSTTENPRKRTRLVEGKVMDSPRISYVLPPHVMIDTAVPDLSNEYPTSQPSDDPLMIYFQPPKGNVRPISQADCADVAAV